MINFIFSKFEKKDNNLQKEIECLKNIINYVIKLIYNLINNQIFIIIKLFLTIIIK